MAKNSSKKPTFSSDSFIEAFRDLGKNFVDTAKNDLIKKSGRNIVDTFTPGPRPGTNKPSSLEFSDSKNLFSKEQELEEKYKKQLFWQKENLKKQEKIVYSRQERETNLQVQALQQEIQGLVRASAELSQEVEVAAFNLPPQAGKYHISFFERLRVLIKNLKSKIQESSYWLTEWNKKAQKRNFYWKQAKKQESSFLLHHDRQVSTQTG